MSTNSPDIPDNHATITCPICLTQNLSSNQIYNTTCNHIFCKECIQTWKKINITCPVCRTQIKSPDMVPPYDSVYNRDIDIITSLASRKPDQARLLYQEYMRWLSGNRNSRPVITL